MITRWCVHLDTTIRQTIPDSTSCARASATMAATRPGWRSMRFPGRKMQVVHIPAHSRTVPVAGSATSAYNSSPSDSVQSA